MLDIERYRRVNVHATATGLLYTDSTLLAPEKNMGFLRQCIARFSEVNFADQRTGRICLSLRAGEPIWADRAALEHAFLDADTRAALEAIAAKLRIGRHQQLRPAIYKPRMRSDTARRLETGGRRLRLYERFLELVREQFRQRVNSIKVRGRRLGETPQFHDRAK